MEEESRQQITTTDFEKKKRGKLTIFFGMCMGVGKTEAMLDAAYKQKLRGLDVIVANVREDRQKAIVKWMSQFERISVCGDKLDLDAILDRSPALIVIDGLAHINPPGSRHLFRYQDVDELLDEGINVYTTLSLLQLESKKQVLPYCHDMSPGVTVPDFFFERADIVKLVDIQPDTLIKRVKSGFADIPFTPEQINLFYKKENLVLLRKMAQQIISFRRHDNMNQILDENQIEDASKSGMRLLVAINESPQVENLIRRAKNLAYMMGTPLYAVHIEVSSKLTQAQQIQLNKNLSLAYRMGAYVLRTSNNNWEKEMEEVIKREKITHLVVERYHIKTLIPMPWLKSPVEKLIAKCSDIDVYVLSNDIIEEKKSARPSNLFNFSASLFNYCLSSCIVFLFMGFISLFDLKDSELVTYFFLLLLASLSIFYSTGPILVAAIFSSMWVDYYYFPPLNTFALKQADLMFIFLFLSIPLITTVFTTRLRRVVKNSREREMHLNTLLELSKHLGFISGIDEVVRVASRSIKETFGVECAFILKTEENRLNTSVSPASDFAVTPDEYEIANWVFEKAKPAGKYEDTFPEIDKVFYPLNSVRMRMGVVVINPVRELSADEKLRWITLKRLLSNALEREYLNEMANHALILSESDKLYKTLFNSISHEFRIPVATILTASETMKSVDLGVINNLGDEIYTAASRLHRLIENLLSMSRVDSGRLKPRFDWHDVHDLVSSVVGQLKSELSFYKLNISIPENLPLVRFDFGLMEQILYNLLYNITLYVEQGCSIDLKFSYRDSFFIMEVADSGKGFVEEDLSKLFQRFFRGNTNVTGGSGLGLSIVKGYVDAHNGSVIAENKESGGARIVISIPSEMPVLS